MQEGRTSIRKTGATPYSLVYGMEAALPIERSRDTIFTHFYVKRARRRLMVGMSA